MSWKFFSFVYTLILTTAGLSGTKTKNSSYCKTVPLILHHLVHCKLQLVGKYIYS